MSCEINDMDMYSLMVANNDGMLDRREIGSFNDVVVRIPEIVAADEGMIDLRELPSGQEVSLL